MNISNDQLMDIGIIIMLVIIFIYNNTSKHPLEPISWNSFCLLFIGFMLLNIYRTYQKEKTQQSIN
jgi:hypothetical protein